MFENVVANQLAAYGELSFYNKKNTAEIDFIVNKSIAIEAKLTGTEQDARKLQKLATGLGIEKYYVVSKNYSETDGVFTAVNI